MPLWERLKRKATVVCVCKGKSRYQVKLNISYQLNSLISRTTAGGPML